MKTANILLSLAGDTGNQVEKRGVTAAEVALLREIHGDDAVTEIELTNDDAVNDAGTKRTNRQELTRLRAIYTARVGQTNDKVIDILYPGAAARVFEDFDELELPDAFFKATSRATPEEADPADTSDVEDEADDEPVEDKHLEDMTKAELVATAKKRGVRIDTNDSKAEILAQLKAAQQPGFQSDDDVSDMNDSVLS